MAVAFPASVATGTPFDAALGALPTRLRLRLVDFTRLLETADRAASPAWRAEQMSLSPRTWTARVCDRVGHWPFQPLVVCTEAATALLRRFGLSAAEVAIAMEHAGALDTLAVGTDISRDDPAWVALITGVARDWRDEPEFAVAMAEAAVWAFRAWAVTLPAPGADVAVLACGRA